MSSLVTYLRDHFKPPQAVFEPKDELGFIEKMLASDPKRLAHVQGVCRVAEQLAVALGLGGPDATHLRQAARFHDIGYSPEIKQVGFHPLDGAIFLAHNNFDGEVVEAVFHHSGADTQARHHSVAAEIYEKFPASPSVLKDALTFCDQRTSPEGMLVTQSERLREIVTRYGPSHPSSQCVDENRVRYRELAHRVLHRIARSAPKPLPWVFMDVDSTLLTRGVALSTANKKALKEYGKSGGTISLATGKHPLGIRDLLAETGLKGIHLTLNGCIRIEGEKRKTLWDLGEATEPLLQLVKKEKISFLAYDEDGIMCDFSLCTPAQLELLASYHEPKPTALLDKRLKPIIKILMYVGEEETEKEQFLRRKGQEQGVQVLRTSGYFLEFVPPGSGKGAAMTKVLAEKKWPDFHSVGLGDSENDLDMLRHSGWAMAVANAAGHILEAADDVVPTCADDGVAHALELLLGRYSGI